MLFPEERIYAFANNTSPLVPNTGSSSSGSSASNSSNVLGWTLLLNASDVLEGGVGAGSSFIVDQLWPSTSPTPPVSHFVSHHSHYQQHNQRTHPHSQQQQSLSSHHNEEAAIALYERFRKPLIWLSLAIMIIGLVGNLASFVVLVHPVMRTTTNIFLSNLCMSSFLALLGLLINSSFYEIAYYYGPRAVFVALSFLYPFVYPLVTTFQMACILLTVCVSVNQFLCVYKSKAKSYSKMSAQAEYRTATRVVCGVYAMSGLYCIPYWLKFTYDPARGGLSETPLGTDAQFVRVVHFWMYLPIAYVIPFSILIVTNAYLLSKLMVARRRRDRLGLTYRTATACVELHAAAAAAQAAATATAAAAAARSASVVTAANNSDAATADVTTIKMLRMGRMKSNKKKRNNKHLAVGREEDCEVNVPLTPSIGVEVSSAALAASSQILSAVSGNQQQQQEQEQQQQQKQRRRRSRESLPKLNSPGSLPSRIGATASSFVAFLRQQPQHSPSASIVVVRQRALSFTLSAMSIRGGGGSGRKKSNASVNANNNNNNANVSKGSSYSSSKLGRTKVTCMLVAVVFFFFICQFPNSIIHILHVICTLERVADVEARNIASSSTNVTIISNNISSNFSINNNNSSSSSSSSSSCTRTLHYRYGLVISKFLLISNLSFNFACYCLFSEKFRDVLLHTLLRTSRRRRVSN